MRRGRFGRLIVAILLSLGAFVLTLPATAGPEKRLDRVEQEQERIRRKLEQVEARGDRIADRVAALDEQRARVEAEVEALSRRMRALDLEVERARSRLAEAQKQLALVSEKLDGLRARLAAREGLFRERAISAYMAGPAAAMDTLLSSEDFSDFLDRFAYYESALDADSELLEEIKVLEQAVARHRDTIEAKKDQILADKSALEERRIAVAQIRDRRAEALAEKQSAVAAKKSLLAAVRARSGKLRDIERQLERESDRIEFVLAQQSLGFSGAAPGGHGQLAWPVDGPVTSGFGIRVHPLFGERRMHTGIDIGAGYGAPVWAADGGVVAYVGTMSGYGTVVIIDHGEGLATTYNHLSAYVVDAGGSVDRGQPIAAVGCTGYCTGPHLHFEVRVGGTPVDPMPYLR
jgi:murein DD-endopeptidase MepM/ murein hydrolase activator NlpD